MVILVVEPVSRALSSSEYLVLDATLDALELFLVSAAFHYKIPPFAVGHDLALAIVISQAGHKPLAQLPAVAVLQNFLVLRHMVPL